MNSANDISVPAIPQPSPSLWLLFREFFRLGATSWGGFALMSAAHRTFVEERALVRAEEYSDAVALAWTIPGPVAANVVAQLGYRMRGAPGMLVSGVAAILPFFLALIAFSTFYAAVARNNGLIAAIVAGFIPAVCATITVSAFSHAKQTIRSSTDAAIALAAALTLVACKGAFAPLLVMASAGGVGCLAHRLQAVGEPAGDRPMNRAQIVCAVLLIVGCLSFYLLPGLLPTENGPLKLLAVCAGISLTLFGGGLVVVPMLQHLAVTEMHWVDANGFAAAIAASQMSPGPILSSATFIGHQVAGIPGAIAATLGIFGPPAVLMVICSGFVDRLKGWAPFARAMRGVRASVTGLVFVSVLSIAANGKGHPASLAIFAAVIIAQIKFRIEPALLLPIAGLVGWLVFAP
jgi:chromate transporter